MILAVAVEAVNEAVIVVLRSCKYYHVVAWRSRCSMRHVVTRLPTGIKNCINVTVISGDGSLFRVSISGRVSLLRHRIASTENVAPREKVNA
jgi:hypothetical protein